MSILKYIQKLPKGYVTMAGLLAEKDLVNIKRTGDADAEVFYKIPKHLVQKVVPYPLDKNNNAIDAFLDAELFGRGIKVFRPTAMQALMSLHTTLNIEFDDYNQPFPTVVIELPEEASKQLVLSNGNTVDTVILQHFKEERLIFFNAIDSESDKINSVWLPRDGQTLEDYIVERLEGNFELLGEAFVKAVKIALNYCLLLDEFGTKRVGPQNPSHYDRLQRRSKKKTGHEKDAELELKMHPIVYTIDQTPVLYTRKVVTDKEAKDTGEQVHPHLRRGHYCNQPYGPNGSLRKRIRRPPVFVNSHLFLGNMTDVKVTYKCT